MMKFDWIVNKLKERIYPYTHADAVIMDDEETKLSEKFEDVDEHLADTALHVPTGGNVGQVLTKTSDGNAWETIHNEGIEVVDNLTTDDATKALSAAQGKVLKGLIDNGGSSGLSFHEMNLSTSAIKFVTLTTMSKICTDVSSIDPINANSSVTLNIVIDETVTGGETLALLHIGMHHNDIWVGSVSTIFTKADGYTYNSIPVNVYTCVFYNRGTAAVQLAQGNNLLRGTILIKDN